jgi:hypothetical protein
VDIDSSSSTSTNSRKDSYPSSRRHLPSTELQKPGAGFLTQHSDDDRAAELVLDRWLKERQ